MSTVLITPSEIMLTADEARNCVQRIRAKMHSLRNDLLVLYEREGWRALGYQSWQTCIAEEFGYSKAHAYRLLESARVDRILTPDVESPIGDSAVSLPESHTRELAKLGDPETIMQVWQEIVEEHKPTVTAKEIKKRVQRHLTQTQTIDTPAESGSPPEKPMTPPREESRYEPDPAIAASPAPAVEPVTTRSTVELENGAPDICPTRTPKPTHRGQGCGKPDADALRHCYWKPIADEIARLPDLNDEERAVECNGMASLFQSFYRTWDTYYAIPALARYIAPLERVMEQLRDDLRQATSG